LIQVKNSAAALLSGTVGEALADGPRAVRADDGGNLEGLGQAKVND
jgi:hypothetical protein